MLLGYVAQELNFHEEGYETHYGQIVEECRTQRVWEELKASCEFDKRCSDVEAFNAQHRWKKRGVAMVPTKFGISFTTKFLNQVLGLRKKSLHLPGCFLFPLFSLPCSSSCWFNFSIWKLKPSVSFSLTLVQAGALVQVYTDGTVLVTHGGVEMGQGLHTKMAQIAASSFGISPSHVFISETSTDKVQLLTCILSFSLLGYIL